MTRSDHSDRLTVAVVYGGASSEHAVSCVTAQAIMSHLDPDKVTVVPVGITRDGVWTVGTTDRDELTMSPTYQPEVRLRQEVRLATSPQHRGQFTFVGGEHAGELYATVDVIFPALHGKFGEDGTVQGLFELSGVAYVGCGVLASALCMDKVFTKKILQAAGIAVAPGVVLSHGEDTLDAQQRAQLGLPVYVKPATGGSSFGVSKVSDWEQLTAAIATARAEDAKVLVESELVGPEIEIGVLQYPDGRLLASLPAQLEGTTESEAGFYDFETKYLDSVVSATIPAPISQEQIELLRSQAVAAFQALGAQGLARVDFFLTAQGPVVNEVNTMPGFTPISMYPQVLGATGVEYSQLVEVLLDTALQTRG